MEGGGGRMVIETEGGRGNGGGSDGGSNGSSGIIGMATVVIDRW